MRCWGRGPVGAGPPRGPRRDSPCARRNRIRGTGRPSPHDPVSRRLGQDRRGGDGAGQAVAADHRMHRARHGKGVVPSTRASRSSFNASTARRMARPVACRMFNCAISAAEAKPTAQATALAFISTSRASRRLADSFLESFRPLGTLLGWRITAAADTGPAQGPRPASSTPHTGPSARPFQPHVGPPFIRPDPSAHRLVAKAACEVVVDHAGRLHEGVDDHRSDELEAPGLERLGHLFRAGVRAGTCAMCSKAF